MIENNHPTASRNSTRPIGLEKSTTSVSSVFIHSVAVVIACLVLAWWALYHSSQSEPVHHIAVAVPTPADLSRDEAVERKRRLEFFQSQVVTNLQQTDAENQLAAKRCVQQIEHNFQRYRERVPEFVDDLTGMKSRFGILKRMPGGWWSSDERVSQYISEKFEEHLFSEASLTSDLKDALETFRADVRANQRELLTKTQAAVEQSDLPPIRLDDYEAFFTIVNQQINQLADTEAQTSVNDGVLTLVVSEAGSAAAGMIAGRLIASLGTATAATVATSGSATAGGAAAGAAGGSIVPGPGTVVGFGVGLIVGFGIDYWMNKQTAAKLNTELLLYINEIESNLLLGPVADSKVADAASAEGIQAGVNSACERLKAGVHQRLFDIIVLEQSP